MASQGLRLGRILGSAAEFKGSGRERLMVESGIEASKNSRLV